jgi:hypothetical protein
MMILFAVLVAGSAFFACLGAWPAQRQRLIDSWASHRLRQRFRSGVQRARLRSIR